ncbi:MAG TPA: hypothetical protein VFG03_21840, partial [Telluria sp.]|nr:hypothetical protein [Telluria sp.]
MTAAVPKEPAELFNSNLNLDRTSRPESEPGAPFWELDVLKWIGKTNTDCSAFNVLLPETLHSLRDHLISFALSGKYSASSFQVAVRAFNYTLAQCPTREFDLAWLMKAITITSFQTSSGLMKSFFIYWQDRYPSAITSDALLFLSKPVVRKSRPKNVLSDDPEKSWLTDFEYDALLQCVWANYDQGTTGTQTTLLRLLSMQYGRRPVQFASLKIGDFRDDASEGNSTSERRIHFPGAKDRSATNNFRDSKEEVHPVADHLWDLFQIQKHEVKALFNKKLDITLTKQELAQLPVFSHEARIEMAIEALTDHYHLDWRSNFDSQLFHVDPEILSKILSWDRNTLGNNTDKTLVSKPPFSHRTGRPVKVTATRLRHTRARQLARLGTPKNVLSFWLGHESRASIDSYYNDPAEEARQINEAMTVALAPLAMAFTGKLLNDDSEATRANDPDSTLEFASEGNLKNVGKCGQHSFCATTSVPIPCYRCKMFEPLVHAPHEEVLHALLKRQAEEHAMIKIGGARKLLMPIDLGPDIRAVQACITRCNARKDELEENN